MQTKQLILRARPHTLLTCALICIAGIPLSTPSAVYAQDRSHDNREPRNRQDRDSGRNRREDRSISHRQRDTDRIRFTHSQEGRRFDNGVMLRRSEPVVDRHVTAFFPQHYASYPHYAYKRDGRRTVISPFSFYVGIFPPYIERSSVLIVAPRRVYIEVPIYVNGEYRPYGLSRDDDYYLNHRDDDTRWKSDPDLRQTVYDLEDTFRNEDIALLAPLTDPATNIAIYTKGKFQYSLNPNDYLDMTRDFLRNAHTTEYAAYRVHEKARNVYQVFAKHVYQDQDGQSRTVYLCTVLERISDRWTITQIDTSPANN